MNGKPPVVLPLIYMFIFIQGQGAPHAGRHTHTHGNRSPERALVNRLLTNVDEDTHKYTICNRIQAAATDACRPVAGLELVRFGCSMEIRKNREIREKEDLACRLIWLLDRNLWWCLRVSC